MSCWLVMVTNRCSSSFGLSLSLPLFLSLSPSLSLPHSLPLSPSLSLKAGSEHYLLGSNITVAVLGIVIPIGTYSYAALRIPCLYSALFSPNVPDIIGSESLSVFALVALVALVPPPPPSPSPAAGNIYLACHSAGLYVPACAGESD